jgi:hypothetical protein
VLRVRRACGRSFRSVCAVHLMPTFKFVGWFSVQCGCYVPALVGPSFRVDNNWVLYSDCDWGANQAVAKTREVCVTIVTMLALAFWAACMTSYFHPLGRACSIGPSIPTWRISELLAHGRQGEGIPWPKRNLHYVGVKDGELKFHVARPYIQDAFYFPIEDRNRFLGVTLCTVFSMGGLEIYIVPLWIPAAVLSIIPVLAACRTVARHRRGRKGCCVICAYDLRGSQSGRCPECGRHDGRDRATPVNV